MKRTLTFCALAAAAVVFTTALVAQSVPEIAFDSNADLLKMPPNTFIGEVAGVAANSKGNIFVYNRTGHSYATLGDSRTFYHAGSRLFEFDQTGKFVRELGQDLYGFNAAQGVRVDPQDNVWTIDAGASQIVKFDANGNVQLVLGRKPEAIGVRAGAAGGGRGGPPLESGPAATSAPGGAAPPAAAGAAPGAGGRGAGGGRGGGGGRGAGAGAGAPGGAAPAAPAAQAGGAAGGGRAAAGGAPAGGFGGRGGGRGPGAGAEGSAFSRPTDVAWDRNGNIFIADGVGSNNRIAKFDKDGKFLKSWGQTGAENGQFQGVKSMATDAAGNIYVADAGNKRIQVFDGEGTFKSQITGIGSPQAICITKGATQYIYSAHSGDPDGMVDSTIYKVGLDGKVLGKFGTAGKLPKEFGLINSIDCRTENELLVGEMTNWRVQKITLKAGR